MKLGLALSGGGIRGIAHAGALKALEDNNIKIDAIGGTSSGGIIASLYAMGYTPYYIYVLFKKYAKDITKVSNGPILTGIGNFMKERKVKLSGFRTGKSIEQMYNELSKKKGVSNISDIKMPIVIPAVDISENKEYIFTNYIPKNEEKNDKYITEIPVGKAVRASSSFPAFFCPCKFKQHRFLDGGVLNNIPVEEVKKQGVDKVIALNFKSDVVDDNSNIMDIVMKTIDIMGSKISEDNLQKSDFILTIYTDKTGLLDIEKLDSCYQYGYDAVIENLEKIKELINN